MAGRFLIALGAALAALAVALGAFRAHGLAQYLEDGALPRELLERSLDWFDTAQRYHQTHSLALILLGLAAGRTRPGAALAAGWLFGLGLLLFSGSLYGLALGGPSWFAHLAPFGGGALILGWACFALAALLGERS